MLTPASLSNAFKPFTAACAEAIKALDDNKAEIEQVKVSTERTPLTHCCVCGRFQGCRGLLFDCVRVLYALMSPVSCFQGETAGNLMLFMQKMVPLVVSKLGDKIQAYGKHALRLRPQHFLRPTLVLEGRPGKRSFKGSRCFRLHGGSAGHHAVHRCHQPTLRRSRGCSSKAADSRRHYAADGTAKIRRTCA